VAKLSVNVDHVATLRQARRTVEPDPVAAALKAELAGADAITAHLREDRRHIQDRDIELLRKTIKTRLNLEMAATEEMLSIALDVKPDMVTLVPEKRQELTTEGGLDIKAHGDSLKRYISTLRDAGICVNLFLDPVADSMRAAKNSGANGVEIHTGRYAEGKSEKERAGELKRIHDCAVLARRLNLKIHAGHGLDYRNIADVARIKEIEEFAIGFSIIARSVYVGIEGAVREMLLLIR
jgi:pyridoxine 5-phosphate synthase